MEAEQSTQRISSVRFSLSVCLFVSLFVSVFLFVSVSLYADLCACLCLCMSSYVCLSVSVFCLCLFLCLSVRMLYLRGPAPSYLADVNLSLASLVCFALPICLIVPRNRAFLFQHQAFDVVGP